MSDRSSGVSRWVRGLFGSSDEPPKFPGEESRNTGARTVLSAEGLACDAICRPAARPSLPVPHNVFGRAVADTVVDRAGGAVATANGLAMYGRRVAAFVPAGRIAEWRDAVRSATDRHIPLVVHTCLDPTTHANYHAAADLGPLVALARDAQQADVRRNCPSPLASSPSIVPRRRGDSVSFDFPIRTSFEPTSVSPARTSNVRRPRRRCSSTKIAGACRAGSISTGPRPPAWRRTRETSMPWLPGAGSTSRDTSSRSQTSA